MSLSSLLFPPQPVYFYKQIYVPALAPDQLQMYDEENTLRHYRKFIPFTNIQIVNTSEADIEILLDYSREKRLIVLAGGTKALRNQPFRCWSVKNLDDVITTTATDINIELETIR